MQNEFYGKPLGEAYFFDEEHAGEKLNQKKL